MKPLRPMFVTGSLVHGGAERHSITLMNRLAERGHPCHAVYIKNDPSQLERILPVVAQQGGTIRCMNATRFYDTQAIDRLAAHLLRVRPSVLVAANGYALMNATLARQRARLPTPVVVTFHTMRVLGLKEQLKTLIDRPFFWQADRCVFVCATQRRYWLRRGLCAFRNEVIYNGVDTGWFDAGVAHSERLALRRSLGIEAAEFVIGLSAVLRPEKNPLQLLDAVATLRRRGIAARALIIGDGPLRGAIEQRARELGIDAYVQVTGLQQDVRPSLSICDAVVLCSVSETFSLAALEAMAMGKPVVLSDVGGAQEMVAHGKNGFLFPVADTHALINCLAALAERVLAKRMGRMARFIASNDFSEEVMVDRYETLLQEVCGSITANPSASVSPSAAPSLSSKTIAIHPHHRAAQSRSKPS